METTALEFFLLLLFLDQFCRKFIEIWERQITNNICAHSVSPHLSSDDSLTVNNCIEVNWTLSYEGPRGREKFTVMTIYSSDMIYIMQFPNYVTSYVNTNVHQHASHQ